MEATARTVWRASWQLRTFAYVAYAGFLVIIAAVLASEPILREDLIGYGVMLLLFLYFLSAIALAPRVAVSDEGVIKVTNPVLTRTFPVTAVTAIESAGRRFLYLTLAGHAEVQCWAIQATNLMLWLKRTTRVDVVAAELGKVIGPRVGLDAESDVKTRLTPPPLEFWILLLITVLGNALAVWLGLHTGTD